VFRFAVEPTFYRQPDFFASHRAITFHKEIANMFNTGINSNTTATHAQAERRRIERDRLRRKRENPIYRAADRLRNKHRMRRVRAAQDVGIPAPSQKRQAGATLRPRP
jgi:hypothetical protein